MEYLKVIAEVLSALVAIIAIVLSNRREVKAQAVAQRSEAKLEEFRAEQKELIQQQQKQLGTARLEPSLSGRVARVGSDQYVFIDVTFTQKGSERLKPCGFTLEASVLGKSSLILNGHKEIKLDLDRDIDEFTPDRFKATWHALLGYYEYGRTRTTSIPIKVGGSGLLTCRASVKVEVVAPMGATAEEQRSYESSNRIYIFGSGNIIQEV